MEDIKERIKRESDPDERIRLHKQSLAQKARLQVREREHKRVKGIHQR